MLVLQIGVRNFKAFLGEHSVRFERPTKNKNVYLLGALNGAGKTSIVQAMQLTLFGQGSAELPGMFGTGRDSRRRYETWLAACLNRAAAQNGQDEMSVQLSFESERVVWTVTRSYWFSPTGDLEEETLECVANDPALAPLHGNDAQDLLLQLAPRNLAELIFFDGERVRDLDSGGDGTGWLVRAVDQLMDLEPVHKLRRDLVRLSRDRRASVATQAQLENRNRLEQIITDATSALRKSTSLLRGLQAELADVELALRDLDNDIDAALSGSQPLSTAQLETEVAEHVRRRDELRSRIGRHLADWAYLETDGGWVDRSRLAASSSRESRAAWESQKLVGEALHTFVEAVLADVEQSESKAAARRWSARLEELAAAQLPTGADAYDGVARWTDLFTADELADVVHAAEAHIARDRTELRHLAEDLRLVQQRISSLGESRALLETHFGLEKSIRRRDELVQARAALMGRIELIAQEEHGQQAKLQSNKSALRTADEMLTSSAEANDWLLSAQALELGLAKYVERRRDLALKDLAVGVRDLLSSVLRKRKLVADVVIDPESQAVLLKDAAGRTVKLPSAGEHQLASLAFASTMLSLGSADAPFIIDTPLARLDGVHRSKFVTEFLAVQERQVFILSTDEEIDAPLVEMLRPRLVQTFLIEHDEESGSSRIQPGRYVVEPAA
jgi:DNA sulfur modification protein DndD